MSGTEVYYAAGDMTALVGPSALLLVGAAPRDAFVHPLWTLVQADASVAELGAALAAQAARGLTDFALVRRGETGIGVLVRGAVTVTMVDLDNRTQQAVSTGQAEWLEVPFERVAW